MSSVPTLVLTSEVLQHFKVITTEIRWSEQASGRTPSMFLKEALWLMWCIGMQSFSYIPLFRSTVGFDFILIYAKGWPHRDHLVDDILESEVIWRVDSPACSHFISIECVWRTLWRRRLHITNSLPRTIEGFNTALLNQWDQLLQEHINHFISNMKS